MLKKLSVGIFFILFYSKFIGQVSIVNSMFNAYNVTPNALLCANITNVGEETEVFLDATLYNGLNQPIHHVVSSTFNLKKGLNNTAQIGVSVKSSDYSNGNDAQYIKTSHQLPSGKFRYCIIVKSTVNPIEADDFCEEFENESTSFLFLINPSDKDTIENKTPILVWNHSDPFTLMQQGETYRLVVVELKNDQSADAGINVNAPILQNNFLTRHDIQYPFDAPKLEDGKRYGWQVQKIINNVVVNKTEAWEFVLKPVPIDYAYKYLKLKDQIDASYFNIKSDKIYFRVDEAYNSSTLNVNIYNDKDELILPKANNERIKTSKPDNLKTLGYNAYELNLMSYKLEKGYYIMEVVNQMNKKSYLKFYVE